jgi:hypothetical protein
MNDKAKSTESAVKAFANHNITRPDGLGGRETIPAKSVFDTTVEELDRLSKLNGAARAATAEEVALQAQRDAKPADEESAGHADVGSYADYASLGQRAEAGKAEDAAETADASKTGKKAGK